MERTEERLPGAWEKRVKIPRGPATVNRTFSATVRKPDRPPGDVLETAAIYRVSNLGSVPGFHVANTGCVHSMGVRSFLFAALLLNVGRLRARH